MPIRAPVFKALVQVVDPWTGLYAGLNAGYSWGLWNSNNPGFLANFPSTATAFTNTASPHVNGMIGGVQLGYNWLLQPNWPVGVEADFQWSGEKDSANGAATASVTTTDFRFVAAAATTNDWKMKWFSTLRARTGFVIADQWLIYATGGLALINASFANTRTTTAQVFTSGGGLLATATASSANSDPKLGPDLRLASASRKSWRATGAGGSNISTSTAVPTPIWAAPAPKLRSASATISSVSV